MRVKLSGLPLCKAGDWGGKLSMGVTSGCVREPGSRTLPFGVGCVGFSTSSKNPHTPPEWGCEGTPSPHAPLVQLR